MPERYYYSKEENGNSFVWEIRDRNIGEKLAVTEDPDVAIKITHALNSFNA